MHRGHCLTLTYNKMQHLPLDHLMHMILCRGNFLSVSSCPSSKSCSLGSLGKPQLFRLWLSPSVHAVLLITTTRIKFIFSFGIQLVN